MTTWLAYTAFVVYLAGIGALAHAVAYFWPELQEENPELELMSTTQPALAPLVLALAIFAWPLSVPLAFVGKTNNSGDPS